MRRGLLVGIAALAPLVVVAPASAKPDQLGTPVYLALGDSVAAGVGAVPTAPGYPTVLEDLLDGGYNPAADRATPTPPWTSSSSTWQFRARRPRPCSASSCPRPWK